MGLRAEITAEIIAAYNTDLSDAVVDLLYVHIVHGEYDPEIGEPLEIRNEVLTRGSPQYIDAAHIDGEVVKVGDIMFIIVADELAATPDVGNVIVHEGNDYYINNVNPDPTKATWEITGRMS